MPRALVFSDHSGTTQGTNSPDWPRVLVCGRSAEACVPADRQLLGDCVLYAKWHYSRWLMQPVPSCAWRKEKKRD